MDSFVTARVPAEIKEQGNALLKSIGSSPTQLVNAAYRYVLESGQLPSVEKPVSLGKRVVEGSMAANLMASIEATTFSVPEDYWGERTYKEMLESGRAADYEALA